MDSTNSKLALWKSILIAAIYVSFACSTAQSQQSDDRHNHNDTGWRVTRDIKLPGQVPRIVLIEGEPVIAAVWSLNWRDRGEDGHVSQVYLFDAQNKKQIAVIDLAAMGERELHDLQSDGKENLYLLVSNPTVPDKSRQVLKYHIAEQRITHRVDLPIRAEIIRAMPGTNTLIASDRYEKLAIWEDFWEAHDRYEIMQFKGTHTSVGFSPDGSRLAITTLSSDEYDVCEWATDGWTRRRTYESPNGSYGTGVLYTEDSRFLIATYAAGSIHMWDTSDGRVVEDLAKGLDEKVLFVRSSMGPDNTLYATGIIESFDRKKASSFPLYLIDLQAKSIRLIWESNSSSIRSIVLLGADTIILGTESGHLVWLERE